MKDYTDITMMFLSEKLVKKNLGKDVTNCVIMKTYDVYNARRETVQNQVVKYHGNRYKVDLDFAHPTRWRTWPLVQYKKNKRGQKVIDIPKTLKEIFRPKRIGLVMFIEPCDHRCSECPDKDGEKCKTIPDLIRPIDPVNLVYEKDEPDEDTEEASLNIDYLTPVHLKSLVDAFQKYRRNYGSFPFGLRGTIMNKWVLIIMGIVVTIVVVIYLYSQGGLG